MTERTNWTGAPPRTPARSLARRRYAATLFGPVQLVGFFNPVVVMCAAFMTTALVLNRWYSR